MNYLTAAPSVIVKTSETGGIDDLTKIILTATGTLVVGVVAALLGAWIQSRREHQTWLRGERMIRYVNYMNVLESLAQERFIVDRTHAIELLQQHKRDSIAVQLVGPNSMRLILDECGQAAGKIATQPDSEDALDAIHYAQALFVHSASKALKIKS